MTALDYPVTFPYGATSAPYSAAHPHRGDDRPCPEGTPVAINGVQIGLSGATGNVIGAHLHIQEWSNDYANTRKPQNAFAPGTVTNIDPDGTQGDGSFGKFITIQTADGWCDTYCHLSEINVSVGQVIGEDMISRQAYLVGAEAVGTQLGEAFNYPENWDSEQFADFLNSQAPLITPEMENQLADAITGITNVIGKGYNSPYVGKKVVTHYPLMVSFWISQRPTPVLPHLTNNVPVINDPLPPSTSPSPVPDQPPEQPPAAHPQSAWLWVILAAVVAALGWFFK